MGAQEITGKIFNSRTLPKPIPDVTSTGTSNSPFNRSTLYSSSTTSNFSPNSAPLNRQDGSLELPKVKREPTPEPESMKRSQQLALAPLRTNGNSPTLLGKSSNLLNHLVRMYSSYGKCLHLHRWALSAVGTS